MRHRLCRKAKQLGLCLVQVPEYSHRLDIHPFVVHEQALLEPSQAIARCIERQLLARFDFVNDSSSAVVRTSVPVPFKRRAAVAATRGTAATRRANQNAAPPETQLVHRSGGAFVRVRGATEFVWVRNRLRAPYGNVIRLDSNALLGAIRAHALSPSLSPFPSLFSLSLFAFSLSRKRGVSSWRETTHAYFLNEERRKKL